MSDVSYSKQKRRPCLTNDQLEIILKRCRLKQRGAQKELYFNYYGYAMAIALSYSSDIDSAIEMTNEAFLKMFKSLTKFRSPYNDTVGSFTAWFKTIIVYSCTLMIEENGVFNSVEKTRAQNPTVIGIEIQDFEKK